MSVSRGQFIAGGAALGGFSMLDFKRALARYYQPMLQKTNIVPVDPFSVSTRSDGIYMTDAAGHIVFRAHSPSNTQVTGYSDFVTGLSNANTPAAPVPNTAYNVGPGTITTTSSAWTFTWPTGGPTAYAQFDSSGNNQSDLFDSRIHPTWHINPDTGEVIINPKPCHTPCPQSRGGFGLSMPGKRGVNPDVWEDCVAAEAMLSLSATLMVASIFGLWGWALNPYRTVWAADFTALYMGSVEAMYQSCHFHW